MKVITLTDTQVYKIRDKFLYQLGTVNQITFSNKEVVHLDGWKFEIEITDDEEYSSDKIETIIGVIPVEDIDAEIGISIDGGYSNDGSYTGKFMVEMFVRY